MSLGAFHGSHPGFLEVAVVLPDDVAIGGVHGHHVRARRDQIHHSVVNDWNRLRRSGGQSLHPGDVQLTDIFLVDLFQRAIAPGVVGAAVLQPIAGRRIQEHLVRYGLVVLDHAVRQRRRHEHTRGALRGARGGRRGALSLCCGRWRCFILRLSRDKCSGKK